MKGDQIKILYCAKLENGLIVEEFENDEKPFMFTLGSKDVIEGLNITMQSMKKGEISQAVIQPKYAYGKTGKPPLIPGNAIIFYEIEVMDIIHDAV